MLLLFVGRDGLSGRDGDKVNKCIRKNISYKLPATDSRTRPHTPEGG